MSQHVIALDQGTTSSRAIIFDVNGKVVSLSQHPFAQIYPQPGWVEHDPMTILYTQLESLSEAIPHERPFRRGHRRHRHHQPARDDDRLGKGNRQPHVQRHRLAVPPHGAYVRRAARRRLGPSTSAKRPAFCSDAYFSGTKLQLDSRQRPRRARARRARRAAVRHGGHMAHLEADRRARPRDRLHQRLPHDAL